MIFVLRIHRQDSGCSRKSKAVFHVDFAKKAARRFGRAALQSIKL
jgi:hypothetical protein